MMYRKPRVDVSKFLIYFCRVGVCFFMGCYVGDHIRDGRVAAAAIMFIMLLISILGTKVRENGFD